MKMNKWHKRHFQRVSTVAAWSKDSSTKVGCVAVAKGKMQVMDGYNGLPSYLDDENEYYHQRPQKYYFFEHAERNMLNKMRELDIRLNEFDLYINWFPCSSCMRQLIASGMKNVYCDISKISLTKSEKYKDDFIASFHHSQEAGINVYFSLNAENLISIDNNNFKTFFQ